MIDELKNDMETLRWQQDRLRMERDMFIRKEAAELQAWQQHN